MEKFFKREMVMSTFNAACWFALAFSMHAIMLYTHKPNLTLIASSVLCLAVCISQASDALKARISLHDVRCTMRQYKQNALTSREYEQMRRMRRDLKIARSRKGIE